MRLSLFAVVIAFQSIAYSQDYVPGEVIIKLRGSSAGISTSSFKSKASNEKQMRLKGTWKSLNMHHYSLKAGANVEATIQELRNDPSVEYVEPNYILRKADIERGEAISEEDFIALAEENGGYSINSNNQNGNFIQTGAPIDAALGWSNLSDTSYRPTVAVIDTGTDLNHPAFNRWCALWTNEAEKSGFPGVDDDGNGYIDDIYGYDFVNRDGNPSDDNGHGTHVAGIVLGTTQDIKSIPEVQPVNGTCNPNYRSRIRIMSLKFLDSDGNGTTSDAIKAIYYAVNNGAKVLNNSWGGGSYSQALHEAIIYAYDRKASFVAAAGNNSKNNDSIPMFPANYDVPNVISVASTTSSDILSWFSNYGRNTVHLSSPGSNIHSTFLGGTYIDMGGTSMAAPFVAGVAALVARENPAINGYQIKEVVLGSSPVVAPVSGMTISGARLNINNSVLASQGITVDNTQPGYNLGSSSYRGLASDSAAAGCGMVSTLIARPPKGGGKGGGNGLGFALIALLFSPVLFLVAKRKKASRRKHERFEVKSQMKVQVGDQEVVGELETISLGGFGIDMNEMLEKGSVVTVKLQTPTGEHEIEVKGKIVWRDGHHHGVQFVENNRGVLDFVRQMITRFATGKA